MLNLRLRLAAYAFLGTLLGACSSHGGSLPQSLPPVAPQLAVQSAASLDDASASTGPIAYIDDVNGILWTVNLSNDTIRRVGEQGVMLTDLGFDPKNHVLYGVSFNALYRVNTKTGTATVIGPLAINDANALVFDATGKGYVKGFQDTDLYSLDAANGDTRVIGKTGDWKSGGDLTFYNNRLVLSGYRGTLENTTKESIVTLNHDTGAVLGAVQTDLTQLYGLVSTSSDHLYGFANYSLYRIIPSAPTAPKRSVLLKNFQSSGVGQILGAAYDGNFQN